VVIKQVRRPHLITVIGLLGLRDRAEALGGRILLDSPAESRTTLRLGFPLTVGVGAWER
jgi:signal transduction histidine kinase